MRDIGAIAACVFSIFLPLFTITLNVVIGWIAYRQGIFVVYIFGAVLYVYIDQWSAYSGGCRRPYLRELGFFWRAFKRYFPASILVDDTSQWPEDKLYLFIMHPHGIVSTSVWVNFIPDSVTWLHKNINYRMATLSVNFYIPFFRDFLLQCGFVPACRESLDACLMRGLSVAITVGGAQESLCVNEGIILHRRLGFVKLALRHGASLVPVYHFGERALYETWATPKGSYVDIVQRALKRWFHFTTPVFYGRYFFFPRAHPITTVIGKPIVVEKTENPSADCIKTLHKRYTDALIDLHERHRKDYNEPALVIVA